MDSTLTNYDPSVPDELNYEDCLELPGKKCCSVLLHKPTGYFYWKNVDDKNKTVSHYCACKQFMKNNHTKSCIRKGKDFVLTKKCCVFVGCGGRHSHPPPCRSNVELILFKWEAKLTQILKAKTLDDIWIVNNMYKTWPFALGFTKPRLKNLLRGSLVQARRIGLAKPGSKDHVDSTFFINQFCQVKVKATKSFLKTSPEYWGPPLPPDDRSRFQVNCFECCKEYIKITERNYSSSSDDESTLTLQQKKRKFQRIQECDSESTPSTSANKNVNSDYNSGGLRRVRQKKRSRKESGSDREKPSSSKVRRGRSADTLPPVDCPLTSSSDKASLSYLEIPESFWVEIANLQK